MRTSHKILHAVYLVLLIGTSFSTVQAGVFDAKVDSAIVFAKQQLSASLRQLGKTVVYPRTTNSDGTWKCSTPKDWTSGFFPGCLWYIYELTGDTSFVAPARRFTEGLSSVQANTRTHDVGFIANDSYGHANRLFPSPEYKQVLLRTAKSLATRYSSKVGCIRSWDNRKWEFPVIIDNMMNLELLFWASQNGGSKELYDIAMTHAATTMRNHIREDGSAYHVVSYDSSTGAVLSRVTHQGYADESAWARGQAWAVYGFTMVYRETKDPRFLATAQKAAQFFIQHLPADFIPYWDFRLPTVQREERDASAAAIAASGLLELSTFESDRDMRETYRNTAESIIAALCSAPYLAKGTMTNAILLHSVGNKPAKGEIDVPLIYADYYFLESLLRYRQIQHQ